MMVKLCNKKDINIFTLLCSVVYFMSYVSRVNLSAVHVAVTESGFSSASAAALALTVCSVTYGAGQLISGFLGDKFKPHNIIFTGFIITSLMNFFVGFVGGNALVVLWAINGFAQSLMWPPLVKIMSEKLSAEQYKKSVVKVSWGSSLGTIAVYLLSPIVINILNVQSVFFVSSVLAILTGVLIKIIFDNNPSYSVSGSVTDYKTEKTAQNGSEKFTKPVIVLLLFIMVAILCQGALRDGVTNWTPTYISQIFNMDSSLSILSGVILPVFSVISYTLASWINRKFIKNELVCAGIVFAVGAVSSVLLRVIGDVHFIVSLLLLALVVGAMHGVNLILVCVIPAYFTKYGKVSLVSGLINSSTYVGAAISTYGVVVFTEGYGWDLTLVLWSAIALLGTSICFIFSKKWAKFKK